jgi:hypothetical protein
MGRNNMGINNNQFLLNQLTWMWISLGRLNNLPSDLVFQTYSWLLQRLVPLHILH